MRRAAQCLRPWSQLHSSNAAANEVVWASIAAPAAWRGLPSCAHATAALLHHCSGIASHAGSNSALPSDPLASGAEQQLELDDLPHVIWPSSSAAPGSSWATLAMEASTSGGASGAAGTAAATAAGVQSSWAASAIEAGTSSTSGITAAAAAAAAGDELGALAWGAGALQALQATTGLPWWAALPLGAVTVKVRRVIGFEQRVQGFRALMHP